jgi:hypothetical protein
MALGTIAAAVAGAVFAFGGPGTHVSAQLAGYSIHRADNGVVTITLTDFNDTGQLSSELKADGIPAVVYLIPLGKICREPGATRVNLKPGHGIPGGLYSPPSMLRAAAGPCDSTRAISNQARPSSSGSPPGGPARFTPTLAVTLR